MRINRFRIAAIAAVLGAWSGAALAQPTALTPPHDEAVRWWPEFAGDGSEVLTFADDPVFDQAQGRLEVRFRVHSVQSAPSATYGLVSRGDVFAGNAVRRDSEGWFGLWTWEDAVHATLTNRNVPLDGQSESVLRSRYGVIGAGTEHTATLSWGPTGLALFVDGVLRVHDHRRVHGTDGEGLLHIGGSPTGRQLDGVVSAALYASEAQYDACAVDLVGSINDGTSVRQGVERTLPLPGYCSDPCRSGFCQDVTLTWAHPTEYTDGSSLPLERIGTTMVLWSADTDDPDLIAASPHSVLVPAPAAQVTVQQPVGARHYVARTSDIDGAISAPSNVATLEVTAVPDRPTDLGVWPEDFPPQGPLTVRADDDGAYTLVQSRDRLALVWVGTVPVGTECDPSQGINGRYVVPWETVSFLGDVRPEVLVARCSAD